MLATFSFAMLLASMPKDVCLQVEQQCNINVWEWLVNKTEAKRGAMHCRQECTSSRATVLVAIQLSNE